MAGQSRTLAVVLGASCFPDSPNLAEGRAFYISAADIKDYLTNEGGLGIPRRNLLSLFDDSRSATDQLIEIAKFLSKRLSELKTDALPGEDLVIYYVGHGLFTRGDQAYCLAVRSTNEINEGASSIRASDLASVIKEHAAFLRRYLILDCCFSASIYKEFQSGPLQTARTKLQHELPRRGTALLCSSSAREASLAPQGLERTMFTSALIKALRQGHARCGARLSFSEVGALVREHLRDDFPHDWVRPEIHSPDQHEGDIAHIPLFPNAAYEETRRASEEAAREEERRKVATAEEAIRQKSEQERLEHARRELAEAAQRERVAREKAEHERLTREKPKARRRSVEELEQRRIAKQTTPGPHLDAERVAAASVRAEQEQPARDAAPSQPAPIVLGEGEQVDRRETESTSRLRGVIGIAALLLVLVAWGVWRQDFSPQSEEVGDSQSIQEAPQPAPQAVAPPPIGADKAPVAPEPQSGATQSSVVRSPTEPVGPATAGKTGIPAKDGHPANYGCSTVDDCETLIAQFPRDADVRHYYAVALEKSGREDDAIAQHRIAVSLPPWQIPRAYLYRDLGQALERKGDLDGALDALGKGLSSWPSKGQQDCASYENEAFGRVLEKKGDYTGALEYWKNLMALGRNVDFCRERIEHISARLKPKA